LSGCAASDPVWRMRALDSVRELEKDDAATLAPHSYRSMLETFEHGEAIFRVQKNEQLADLQYQLTFQKGVLLREELKSIKEEKRTAAEKLAQLAELARQELERRRLAAEAAAEAELKRLEALKAAEALKANGSKDRQLPVSYNVKRGESLPQIAARAEVYNDSSLWPLIYRANRDQVRDPYQLWPGQLLKIPRNYSKEDVAEARRQAQRR
jgi:nucleoid-associated protein YgaU